MITQRKLDIMHLKAQLRRDKIMLNFMQKFGGEKWPGTQMPLTGNEKGEYSATEPQEQAETY